MIVGAWRVRWKAFWLFVLAQVVLSSIAYWVAGPKLELVTFVGGITCFWLIYLGGIWFPNRSWIGEKSQLGQGDSIQE